MTNEKATRKLLINSAAPEGTIQSSESIDPDHSLSAAHD
jgi:hypothetical protein